MTSHLSDDALYDLLDDVPDYTSFLTVDEMRASSRRLADTYPDVVVLEQWGESRGGIPIEVLRIGDGPKTGLMVGLPHPNEPIGAMMLEFLAQRLAEDNQLREQLGYTWYLIKAVDPDGTQLNEGWFKGPFNITNYARNFYRPPSQQQVEWTFPVNHKSYTFNDPLPETQAWMRLIEAHPPDFIFSLHNAGFGGVYLYISHDLPSLYPPFFELVERSGLPLHLGEPEVPFARKFGDAIFGMIGLADMYDFLAENLEGDPAAALAGGASSHEYAQRFGDPFFLVCEMPYFYNDAINDLSRVDVVRRDSVLAGITQNRQTWTFIRDTLARVEGELRVASPFRDSITMNIPLFFSMMDAHEQHARNSPEMGEKASRAECFDNEYGKRFYTLLNVGQLVRMLESEIEAEGERPLLLDALASAQALFESEAAYLEQNIEYDVISIRKLVQVQLGSALLALRNR